MWRKVYEIGSLEDVWYTTYTRTIQSSIAKIVVWFYLIIDKTKRFLNKIIIIWKTWNLTWIAEKKGSFFEGCVFGETYLSWQSTF